MNNYNSIFKFAPGPGVTFTDVAAKSSYGKANFVFIYHNEIWENYATAIDEHKLNQQGLKLYSNKQKTNKLFDEIDELTKRIIYDAKIFENLNLNSFSQEEFRDIFQKQITSIIKYLNYYFLTEYFFFDLIEEKINLTLENKFAGKELTNALTVLLSSLPENNLLTEEKIDRYKLVIKILEDQSVKQFILKEDINKLKEKSLYYSIEKHIKKWGFLNYKDGKKYQAISELIVILNDDLSKGKNHLEKYIQDISEQSLDIKTEQTKLEKELPTEIVWFCSVVREMQEKKFALRIILNKSFFGEESILSLLFREISKRYFVAMNQLEFMTVDEINKLLQNSNFLLRDIIERQNCFAYILENNVYKIYTNDKAEEIVKMVKPIIQKDLNIIKGNIANFGQAKGKAKLIRLTTKVQLIQNEIAKMKEGQILVTETTGPELILAVKKAGAIVTNEGGINSHAAIVSRELNIPCVIGTKIATEVIKDGDMIEVDANKGEVILNGGFNE
jgi:pyruvate,water dikinase